MATCPKCNVNCNPLKFLAVSKWTPYVCSKCNTKSDFSLMQNIKLGLIIGFSMGFLCIVLSKILGAMGFLLSVISIILIVPFYQYYFMKLEIIDKNR